MEEGMKRWMMGGLVLALLGSCASEKPSDKPAVVVTYGILGSVVNDLVGGAFDVKVLMPAGADVHEWAPSAKDIESLRHAALIVRNGLNLEEGLAKALDQAAADGVPTFTAAEHIAVRTVKAGQGLPGDDADQQAGARDPHLWMDPQRMKGIVIALADELKHRFGTDLSASTADLTKRLDALDAQVKAAVAALPPDRRRLVTGHESLGYYAEAYGFTLVGAIIPSLTDQAEVSASDMAALKTTLQKNPVNVIFTELGTPPRVAQALAGELHLKVVEITTHTLPPDGSYFTFLNGLTGTIVGALGASPN
jgi:zinc/manganese transport system substrate-binding protein